MSRALLHVGFLALALLGFMYLYSPQDSRPDLRFGQSLRVVGQNILRGSTRSFQSSAAENSSKTRLQDSDKKRIVDYYQIQTKSDLPFRRTLAIKNKSSNQGGLKIDLPFEFYYFGELVEQITVDDKGSVVFGDELSLEILNPQFYYPEGSADYGLFTAAVSAEVTVCWRAVIRGLRFAQVYLELRLSPGSEMTLSTYFSDNSQRSLFANEAVTLNYQTTAFPIGDLLQNRSAVSFSPTTNKLQ